MSATCIPIIAQPAQCDAKFHASVLNPCSSAKSSISSFKKVNRRQKDGVWHASSHQLHISTSTSPPSPTLGLLDFQPGRWPVELSGQTPPQKRWAQLTGDMDWLNHMYSAVWRRAGGGGVGFNPLHGRWREEGDPSERTPAGRPSFTRLRLSDSKAQSIPCCRQHSKAGAVHCDAQPGSPV